MPVDPPRRAAGAGAGVRRGPSGTAIVIAFAPPHTQGYTVIMGNQFTSPQAARCVVAGCDRAPVARSLCNRHWLRWKNTGDPAGAPRLDPVARLTAKIDKPSDGVGCWLWTGAAGRAGYGNFSLNGRVVPAHRAAYLLLVGPIPTAHEVDHLCFNKRCVRPDHLEAVTPQVNSIRAVRRHGPKPRQMCKKGHGVMGNGDGCPVCQQERRTAWRDGRKTETNAVHLAGGCGQQAKALRTNDPTQVTCGNCVAMARARGLGTVVILPTPPATASNGRARSETS